MYYQFVTSEVLSKAVKAKANVIVFVYSIICQQGIRILEKESAVLSVRQRWQYYKTQLQYAIKRGNKSALYGILEGTRTKPGTVMEQRKGSVDFYKLAKYRSICVQ